MNRGLSMMTDHVADPVATALDENMTEQGAWSGFAPLANAIERELRARPQPAACGKVQEVIGTLLRVSGLDVTLGELCELRSPQGELLQCAEVVGFSRDIA